MSEKNHTSRARKWNRWQDHAAAIAAHIEGGSPFEPACVLEGVSFEAVRDALARQDPDADCIARARASLEIQLAREAREHARNGTPLASSAGWMLERIAPKRWHLPSKVEVSGPEGGPVVSEQKIATEAELVARLEALRAKLGGA